MLRLLAGWVKLLVGAIVFSVYDYGRFALFSSDPSEVTNERQYEALLTKQYHRIEKGLCMPDFRPLFGKDVVSDILVLMETESQRHAGCIENLCALECLTGYISFHENSGHDDNEFILRMKSRVAIIAQGLGLLEHLNPGGYKILSGADLKNAGENARFDEFARARHSIREFDQRPVPFEIIEKAVEDALFAPSVCNRQGWRCHYVQETTLIGQCLSFQSGNRGFGHQVPCLLVITSDMRAFMGARERYQPWIDGGLFSMALMYALHGRGLGSCPLNWSAPIKSDVGLRAKLSIPASESVIMMLAVGYIPEVARVCRSERRSVNKMLIAH